MNSGACGMTIVNSYYLARLVEKGEAENLRLLDEVLKDLRAKGTKI